jgi:hypothetical protein
MKISAARLERDGACKEQVEIVRREWGDGDVQIAARILAQARCLGLTVAWLDRYIPAPARDEYERVRDAAWKEYERARDAARKEYERARDAARKECERARDAALLAALSKEG